MNREGNETVTDCHALKLKEQRKKAQKKYWETHRDYYRNQNRKEAKRVRQERRIYKERIDKAIEWVNKNIDKYECEDISLYDWDASSNPKKLLDILKGDDKE